MSGKELAAEAWKEALSIQLSLPPVLTNAEIQPEEDAAWVRFEAICAEHGLTDEDLEEVAELVFS